MDGEKAPGLNPTHKDYVCLSLLRISPDRPPPKFDHLRYPRGALSMAAVVENCIRDNYSSHLNELIIW